MSTCLTLHIGAITAISAMGAPGDDERNTRGVVREGRFADVIRHTVLFTWKADTPPGHAEAVARELARLPSLIPQIRDYQFGANLGVNPGTFDYCVTALFDSVDDYLVYRDHPDHQAFIATYTAPYVETRASIQFEVGA